MSLRIGILGVGFMGRVHAAAAISAGAEVVAVSGSNPDSSRRAAAQWSAAPVSGIDEMVDLGVDVVHICTPNALHYGQALEVLQRGVPVICEKPLATSSEDANALVEAAATAGIPTAVPFVYRYYPMVLDIRERIRNGSDDNPIWLIHGSYLQDWLAKKTDTNWRVARSLGGTTRAFGDIGVHWCDLAEFVTGQRITRVNARFVNAFQRDGGQAQNQTEDGAVVQFETDHGAAGSVVVSQASAGRRNRLWFSFDGPLESYSFDQESPETAWIGRAHENRVVSRDPSYQTGLASRPNALPAGHPQGYQSCFSDLVTDFYQRLRGGEVSNVLPSFEDGARAASIADAVVQSAEQGVWTDVANSAIAVTQ